MLFVLLVLFFCWLCRWFGVFVFCGVAVFDRARACVRFVALVAPDEWSKNMVRIKDLRMEDKDKNQKDVPLDDLASWRSVFPSE